LAERFLDRAREHYREDRFREALLDLERAESGGNLGEKVAELRKLVHTVASEQHRKEDARRDLLRDAAKRIEAGSLAAGRRILEQASGSDREAEALRRSVIRRDHEVATLVGEGQRLLAQGQHAAAAQRVQRAKSLDAHAEAVARAELLLCHQVLESAKSALLSGKLGRCADELASLGELGVALALKREVCDALSVAQEAGRMIRSQMYGEARRCVLNLHRLVPEAEWVARTVEQLRQLEEVQTELASGPLADTVRVRVDVVAAPAGVARPSNLDQTIALAAKPRLEPALGDGLLLLVDGGGSYLLLRNQRASIGRAAAENPAEVPVLSDLAERHAEVARMDDDYFLFAAKEIEVAGRLTRHQLLRDGDRIVLGRKAKMTFRLPSRQCPTAVLDLSDTTKLPNDVRRVLLFHQHALVGCSSTAHVICRHAGPTLVLFERQGSLWLRAKSDGHNDGAVKPLALGESVEMGGVRLVVEPWRMRATS